MLGAEPHKETALISGVLQWAVLAGSYLALTGSPSAAESIAASLVASTGLLLVWLVRARGTHRFSLRVPWPAIAGRMLCALLRDSLRVGAVLGRALLTGHTGRMTCEPDGVDRYPGETRGERRAVAVLQESIAPNTFVVDADGAQLRVHRLG